MSEDTEELKPLATFIAYDQDDVDRFSHALYYSCILFDIESRLRGDSKYKELSEDVYKYIEELKDFIAETKVSYHLPEV